MKFHRNDSALLLGCVLLAQLVRSATAQRIPEALLDVSTALNNSFPQIWVAEGLVECGAPLVADPCSITFTSELPITSIKTGPSATTTIITESTILLGSRISSNTYTPIISVTTYSTPRSEGNTMTTLARRAHIKIPAMNTSAVTRASSTDDTLTVVTASYRLLVDKVNVLMMTTTFMRRSYDFDNCIGRFPNHDFVSNSLSDVCHFVANVQDWLVSLAPTSAAYMPSWLSYLISFAI